LDLLKPATRSNGVNCKRPAACEVRKLDCGGTMAIINRPSIKLPACNSLYNQQRPEALEYRPRSLFRC
jgi:hypothetical protein